MSATPVKGALCGLAAVAMWAAYMSYARAGVVAGLGAMDFVFLRYSVAGLVMLPWLLANGVRDMGGVGWGRAALLALGAGPVFVGLTAFGYHFAPLSHGAILQPSTVALTSLALGWVMFGEKLSLNRIVGTATILTGIALIASRSGFQADVNAWRGDLIFMFAALFWVGYTVLLKRWRIGAFQGTAAVSVVSALLMLPYFVVFEGFDRMAALPATDLVVQFLVQGLGAGVLALICYGKAVEHLGAGSAALFPALVPAATLLAGVPITGEVPSALEWLGAALATSGLAIALGAIRLPLGGSKRNRV